MSKPSKVATKPRATKPATSHRPSASAKPKATPRTKAKPAVQPKAEVQPTPETRPEPEVEPEVQAQPEPKATARCTTFRVEREIFAQAIAWTARSLPVRPSVPVLAGIRFDLTEGQLRLSSFDYEVSAEMVIPAEFEGTAQLLLPGRLLAEIVRALPAQPVDIAVHSTKVILTCGAARFTLLSMPVEDYPTLPESPPAVGRVEGAALAAAVARVAVAAGRDETLPMLGGVRMEIAGDTITMAATDRYRLAVGDLAWQPQTPGFSAELMIPAKTLTEAAKAFAGVSEVEISLSGQDQRDNGALLSLSGGGRRTTTRRLDPEFPAFRALIPSEFTAHADLPTGPFAETLKRVCLVAEKDTPVRLSFSGGEVKVEAASGDEAQGSEVLAVEWTGEPLEIAFNHAYLLEGLAAAGSPRTRLNVTAPAKPAIMTALTGEGEPASGYEYLIMPVRMAAAA